MSIDSLTLSAVKGAAKRLEGVIKPTPLDYSVTFSRLTGCELYLKLENLQKTGSFKIRGAFNKISLLSEASCKQGVIAASAGNHAQGVAYAAACAGIESTVVMPEGTPISKVMATRSYGAHVTLSGDDYEQALDRAKIMRQETGANFVHSFDDFEVMAGQGTIALELLAELPGLEAIVVPVGGGGLIAGIAFTAKMIKPSVKVFGVQASAAPAAYLLMKGGKMENLQPVRTIADGINVRLPGEHALGIIRQYVDDIALVEEEEIAHAIMLLLERSKIVVEGAGAAALAALLHGRLSVPAKKVAVVLSGGNIDANIISIIIERGLVKSGRRLCLRLLIFDQPGSLSKLLSLIAGLQANLISISHDRIAPQVPLRQAEVALTLETRNKEHLDSILQALKREGYKLLENHISPGSF